MDAIEVSFVVDIQVKIPNGNVIKVATISSSEPLNAIRQVLSELQETAHITCYKFELVHFIDLSDNIVVANNVQCNEYAELFSFSDEKFKTCLLKIVHEKYDLKKIRNQIKKTREIILFPLLSISEKFPLESTVEQFNGSVESKMEIEEILEEEKNNVEQESYLSSFPKVETLFQSIEFGSFFDETLLRTGQADDFFDIVCKHPNEIVQNIFASGWNPPPPSRRVQGDLYYLEVSTWNNGVLFITAVAR
jgi:hypothetical protein